MNNELTGGLPEDTVANSLSAGISTAIRVQDLAHKSPIGSCCLYNIGHTSLQVSDNV